MKIDSLFFCVCFFFVFSSHHVTKPTKMLSKPHVPFLKGKFRTDHLFSR